MRIINTIAYQNVTRISIKLTIVIILTFGMITSSVFSQTETQVQSNVLLRDTKLMTTPDSNPGSLINKGVRSFLMQKVSTPQNMDAFIAVAAFLDSHPGETFTIVIEDSVSTHNLNLALQRTKLKKHIYYPSDNHTEIPTFDAIIKTGKRMLLFTINPTDFSFTTDKIYFNNYDSLSAVNISLSNTDNKLFGYQPLNNIVKRRVQGDTLVEYRIFYPWKKRGIKPNFILVTPSQVEWTTPIIKSLNNSPFYSGTINYKNQILNNIRWIDHFETTTNGQFSFPVTINRNYEIYTPWKEGYAFYPEIVKFDRNNIYQQFSAIKLLLEDELIYKFDFEKGIKNEVDKTLYKNELFNVDFRNDSKFGKTLYLHQKGAAVQFKKNPKFDTAKSFTITAWVKPSSIDNIHTIVSKGETFSFKIRQKGLSFAGTGFASVVFSEHKIKTGHWQHVGCVYVPDYHIQFFLNGDLIFEKSFERIRVNEQALTIGNNFSSEGYLGEMDDLMIWNRALSDTEMKTVYSQQKNNGILLWEILLAAIFVLLVALLLLIYKKRFAKNKKQALSDDFLVADTEISTMSKFTISLFGELTILQKNGENIARQLSPRLKHLFLLLVINRQGVSIEQLNNELWPGVEEDRQKQSRNYAIQQMKKILLPVPEIQLEYMSKIWTLRFLENTTVDFYTYKQLTQDINNQTLSKTEQNLYLSILESGKFLQGVDVESFDQLKAEVFDEISVNMMQLSNSASAKLSLRLGNILLLQDSLNENGLYLSVRSLITLGRNGEAIDLYQTFAKRYKNIYNEPFLVSFQSII